MKTLSSLLTLFLLFVFNLLQGQTKSIVATVENTTSNSGKVVFTLHNQSTFLNKTEKPLQIQSAKIIDGKSSVTFTDVDAGEYAIICYHDKNDNDMMDFARNGMPLEDYGASNNKIRFTGPPKYQDAKFLLDEENLSFSIRF